MSNEIIYPVGWVNPVPEFIAMWQARAELIERELLDDVNAAFAAIPDAKQRAMAQAKFEYSSTMRRDDPLLEYMKPILNWSDSFLNELFIAAAARV
jgi:hypothetical protein